MKILQINSNRRADSMELSWDLAIREDVDVVVYIEPNIRKIREHGWICDLKGDVAARCPGGLAIINSIKGSGFLVLEFQDFLIVGAYISPNSEIAFCSEVLDKVADEIRTPKPVVVVGDFNAKNPAWGGEISNLRGDVLLEFVNRMDLDIINDGRKPTVCRVQGCSYVDLTITNGRASNILRRWEVLDAEVLSDHAPILSCFADDTCRPTPEIKRLHISPGWFMNHGRAVGDKLREVIQSDYLTINQVLEEEVTRTCVQTKFKRNNTVYWWNNELTILRDACRVARKKVQRMNRARYSAARIYALNEWRTKKKEFRVAIIRSKRICWERLCDEVDEDPWGKPYKIVMHRLGRALPRLTVERAGLILKQLFPVGEEITKQEWVATDFVKFSPLEVTVAVRDLSTKKSPGIDGIQMDIVKKLVSESIYSFADLFNRIILEEEVPPEWKVARVVLIMKPNREGRSPGDYRPICLLNSLAKIYEKLINNRLVREMEEKEVLHPRQFGFRRGRSTMDAVSMLVKVADAAKGISWYSRRIPVVVLLDVRNAFNSIPWNRILEALERKDISRYLIRAIQNYLLDRQLIYYATDGIICRKMYKGVPQGSIVGPTLWNITYDDILRIPLPEEIKVVAFADDIALIVTARHEDECNRLCNLGIQKVVDWLSESGLEVAPEKSVALILAGRRKIGDLHLRILGQELKVVKEAKYLGIWLDPSITFIKHVNEAITKATKTGLAISRLMRNVRGPSCRKRRLLASVVMSTLLYGVEVWGEVIRFDIVRKKLSALHRMVALRCARGYRTISGDAVAVIAGIPPIDLSIRMKLEIKRGADKREAYDRMMGIWQERWDTSEKGRWTYVLIPKIDPWIHRRHGETSFELCQLLSGHGSFGTYLKKINKGGDRCRYCDSVDDVRHTLMECSKWVNERKKLIGIIGHFEPENLVQKMLQDVGKFNAVLDFAGILKVKLEDERNRRETV